MGVTRRGFKWGVVCAFDMNMVSEALNKKWGPMSYSMMRSATHAWKKYERVESQMTNQRQCDHGWWPEKPMLNKSIENNRIA